MSGKITISNTAKNVAVIDVEGIIGVPENQQFEELSTSVATYQSFKEIAEKISNLGKKEVIVNIRSTGGNVNDALLIHDALKVLDAKITTRCYGYVASAATIIAQAASVGCREISANSLYLIHKSVCNAEGNVDAISQTMDMLDKTDKRITSIYADRSGKQSSDFAKLMAENNGNGRWLSPEEAIKHGLADSIIAASTIRAEAKQDVLNLGLPPIPKKRRNMMEEVSKTWNKIMKSVGTTKSDEMPATFTDVSETMIDAAELEAAAREVKAVHMEEKMLKIAIETARATATETKTKPKEDPSAQEMSVSANESAYMEDLKRFIGQ